MQETNIFEQLYHIRLESGWKLEDIARHTKIQLKYLQAIEAGDWQKIPPVYDRMIFQAYVHFLKIENEQEYMDVFEKIRKGRKTRHTSTIQRKVKFESEFRKARRLKLLYLGLPIVIVAAIIIFLLTHSVSVAPVEDKGVKEITVYEIVDTLRQEQLKKEALRLAAQREDSVRVDVQARSRTWFRVVKDRADTTEYLLQKGEQVNLQADSVMHFLVGNAAGLDFIVNRMPIGTLGQANEIIAYLKITSKGIAAKRLKKIKEKENKE